MQGYRLREKTFDLATILKAFLDGCGIEDGFGGYTMCLMDGICQDLHEGGELYFTISAEKEYGIYEPITDTSEATDATKTQDITANPCFECFERCEGCEHDNS